MPIYEYECGKCHEITEALQKISDSPLKKCPKCGGKLSKLMSLNAFHLKGEGWYVTDYKGKNSSNKPSAKSDEAKAESSTKKEKKTAKKAESSE
jgi:putative FmdB family regulatory protein